MRNNNYPKVKFVSKIIHLFPFNIDQIHLSVTHEFQPDCITLTRPFSMSQFLIQRKSSPFSLLISVCVLLYLESLTLLSFRIIHNNNNSVKKLAKVVHLQLELYLEPLFQRHPTCGQELRF